MHPTNNAESNQNFVLIVLYGFKANLSHPDPPLKPKALEVCVEVDTLLDAISIKGKAKHSFTYHKDTIKFMNCSNAHLEKKGIIMLLVSTVSIFFILCVVPQTENKSNTIAECIYMFVQSNCNVFSRVKRNLCETVLFIVTSVCTKHVVEHSIICLTAEYIWRTA